MLIETFYLKGTNAVRSMNLAAESLDDLRILTAIETARNYGGEKLTVTTNAGAFEVWEIPKRVAPGAVTPKE